MRVTGASMEPTLPDGCTILVNLHSTERRHGSIFVVRRDGELVIKRVVRTDKTSWMLVSDNPDKHAWPSLPWPADASVVGEVRWFRQSYR